MSLHLSLKEKIESQYAAQLEGETVLKQDALLVHFGEGLMLEIRYLNPDEYVIGWSWGEALLRVDTAPLHPNLKTFPNHLHDAEGVIRADPFTSPGREPWDNVRILVDALLKDPLAQAQATL